MLNIDHERKYKQNTTQKQTSLVKYGFYLSILGDDIFRILRIETNQPFYTT